MTAVPSLAIDLLSSPLQNHPFQSLSVGGAPSASTLPTNLRKSFPTTLFSQLYGTTETMATCIGVSGEDYMERPKSIGVPCAINDVMIVSPDSGAEVPVGQVGEIWLRGSNIMKGYWEDREASEKALTRDGWLKTGDAGYVDEEGYVYVKDRIKDIIIRGGENIDSVAVENALYEADERVLEVAAVGVPDERLGELVAAIVTPKPEFLKQVREEELIARVFHMLPMYSIPVMILVLDERIERNAAGKIMKPALRELAAKEWETRRKIMAGGGGSKAKAKL